MLDDTAGPDEAAGPDLEATVRSYWRRVWLDRDLGALDELITDPSIRHSARGSHTYTTDELKALLGDALSAVRGADVSFDAITVDAPYAWVRLTLQGVSIATMTPLTISWLVQYRFERGRIAETWSLHQANADWSS